MAVCIKLKLFVSMTPHVLLVDTNLLKEFAGSVFKLYPQGGGSILFRNVGIHRQDYTALQLRV